jgi:hypothetical protein
MSHGNAATIRDARGKIPAVVVGIIAESAREIGEVAQAPVANGLGGRACGSPDRTHPGRPPVVDDLANAAWAI